jgi:hypothetical protein
MNIKEFQLDETNEYKSFASDLFAKARETDK